MQKPQQQGEKKRRQLQEPGPGRLRISANCPGDVRKPAVGKAETRPHTPGPWRKAPRQAAAQAWGSRTEGPKTRAKMSVPPPCTGAAAAPAPRGPTADSGSAERGLECGARSPAWASPGTTLRITRHNTDKPDSWDGLAHGLPAPNPALRAQTRPPSRGSEGHSQRKVTKRRDPETVKTEAIPTTIHLWWWGLSRQVVSNSCDPMDWRPPGSSVHGLLQARRLEWAAISLHFPSPGDPPEQGIEPGSPALARQMIYRLSYEGSHLYHPPNLQTWCIPQGRPSLVVQWVRTCPPMQGTRVRYLAREESTSCGATETCALTTGLAGSAPGEATARSPRTTTREQPHSNEDPAQPKISTWNS